MYAFEAREAFRRIVCRDEMLKHGRGKSRDESEQSQGMCSAPG